MGMYTELHFNSRLKSNTPKKVISILKFMVGDVNINNEPPTPSHPLFDDTRWSFMLRCDSSYFDADTYSTIRWCDTSKAYYLNIRTNFKNYNEEIDLFIDWINPYLEKEDGEFLGFSRHETSEKPTLIFKNPDKAGNE